MVKSDAAPRFINHPGESKFAAAPRPGELDDTTDRSATEAIGSTTTLHGSPEPGSSESEASDEYK
jgi:hypothetical protein